jgi:hypothetical protein
MAPFPRAGIVVFRETPLPGNRPEPVIVCIQGHGQRRARRLIRADRLAASTKSRFQTVGVLGQGSNLRCSTRPARHVTADGLIIAVVTAAKPASLAWFASPPRLSIQQCVPNEATCQPSYIRIACIPSALSLCALAHGPGARRKPSDRPGPSRVTSAAVQAAMRTKGT